MVRGLCQLLFTSNHKAIDSSLAALSNLSLDERTTDLIHNELNMVSLYVCLAVFVRISEIRCESTSKSKNTGGRGAGAGRRVEMDIKYQVIRQHNQLNPVFF